MQKKLTPKFRKLSLDQRIAALHELVGLREEDIRTLAEYRQTLDPTRADRMIENVIGVFGLPLGLAINFPVNRRYYAVPMVVEEPSVVAALSYAGLLAEKAGGYTASSSAPVLCGQLQLLGVDPDAATAVIDTHRDRILASANQHLGNMVARGGGARSLTVRKLRGPNSAADMLIIDIAIDTRDAMGANLVNTVCEALAPLVEALTGGEVLLRILSNLADQSLAVAEVNFPVRQLGTRNLTGEQMRDRIVMANDFALSDPYRAATHNKGIMNGIDAVALATGNDWRSVEAGAHAYAARNGSYQALTQWTTNDAGDLAGWIELPLKVGTVGASLQTNPAVSLNQRILGIESAQELAGLLAAVGLAQNFAALRALVSSGIQKGHMTLHARSVALTAGAPDDIYEEVVRRLVADGEIKVQRAKEIIDELRK